MKSNYEVLADTENWKMFSTTCQCNSDNHKITVMISKEKDIDYPLIELYFNVYWMANSKWDCDTNAFKQFLSRFIRIYERIKLAVKVLFTGQIELEESFMFRDKEHIEDFNNAIQTAISELNGETNGVQERQNR